MLGGETPVDIELDRFTFSGHEQKTNGSSALLDSKKSESKESKATTKGPSNPPPPWQSQNIDKSRASILLEG